jgi:hypothetical protein
MGLWDATSGGVVVVEGNMSKLGITQVLLLSKFKMVLPEPSGAESCKDC